MKGRKNTTLIISVSLVLILGVLFLMPACTSKPPAPAKVIEWRMSQLPTSTTINAGAEWWAEQMEKRTNGQFKVKIYYATLAPIEENLDGIKAGLFEMAQVSPGYTPKAFPIGNFFYLPNAVPEEVKSHCNMLLEGYTKADALAEYAAYDAIPLVPGVTLNYEMIGNVKLTKAEDLNGVRIRYGLPKAATLKHYGAVITMIPHSEIYNALQRGMLDLAGSTWTAVMTSSLHEVSDYLNMNTGTGAIHHWLIAKKSLWDALPENIKAVHKEIMAEYPDYLANEVYAKEAETQMAAIKQTKIEVVDFPATERAKLDAVAATVQKEWLDQMVGEGLMTREMADYLIELKSKYLGS